MSNEKKSSGFSKLGLILSVVGAAVGLGNIWGFPKALLTHGGIVFLIPYVISLLTLGLPVMLLELNVGAKWRKGPLISYGKYWKKGGPFVGGIQSIGEVLIGSYYVFFIGYVLLTMFNIWGSSLEPNSIDYHWFRHEVIQVQDAVGEPTNNIFVSGWLFVLVLVVFVGALFVALGGAKGGIEKVNKVAVPLLFLLIIGLLGYSLTLSGAQEFGVNPLFRANFGSLKNPKMWSDAFGRSLFSLSLACGIIVIYSSKAEKPVDNTKQTLLVIVADTMVGIFAAIIMGATLGHMVYLQESGEIANGAKLLVPGGDYSAEVGNVVGKFDEKIASFNNGDVVNSTTFLVQKTKDTGVFDTQAAGSTVVWSVLPIFFTTIKNVHGAKFVATMFFVCLFLAAFSSFISQVETGVASTEEMTPLSRKKSTYLTIALQMVTGIYMVFAANQGLADVFDEIFWTGFALVSVFIFLLFFLLQKQKTKELLDFNNQHSKWKIGMWFYYVLMVSFLAITFVIIYSAVGFFGGAGKAGYENYKGYSGGQWATILILVLVPYFVWPLVLIKCYFDREKFNKMISNWKYKKTIKSKKLEE